MTYNDVKNIALGIDKNIKFSAIMKDTFNDGGKPMSKIECAQMMMVCNNYSIVVWCFQYNNSEQMSEAKINIYKGEKSFLPNVFNSKDKESRERLKEGVDCTQSHIEKIITWAMNK